MEKKNFGIALILWILGGWFWGFHRVYIKESAVPLVWYWLCAICSFGILPIVDLFLMKGMIDQQYMNEYTKREMLRNSSN